MPSVDAKLGRLRNWFVAYFVVASALANVVTVRVLDAMRGGFASGYGTCPASLGGMAPAVLVELGVLALFLWVFHALMRLRGWARVVLLVFAWLGVAGAAMSILSAGCLGAARHWLPDIDLDGLQVLGLVSNLLNAFLWGYVVRVLQFDAEVKAAFAGPPAA
jgi:hypothetical protein